MVRSFTLLLVVVLLGLGPVRPAAAQTPQNPSFNLVNRAAVPIKELFFTPAGDANWGRDRLEGRMIAPGASYPARRRIDGNCVFDIRVVFADGRIEDRRGLNTCDVDDVAFGAAPMAGRKPADDPSFKLVNRGTAPLIALFATPTGTGNWGQNRLAGPLPPQTDRLIVIPRGECRFDLRVEFEGGRRMERHRADLCRITDLPVR
jgi:hypothetical protein